jgi:hypothetical protein
MTGPLRSRLSRRVRAFRGRDASTGALSAKEPCAVCGEETVVGSLFYSDRHVVEHAIGGRTYLCTLCDERVRSIWPGKRPTDQEMREVDPNGMWAILATLKIDPRG